MHPNRSLFTLTGQEAVLALRSKPGNRKLASEVAIADRWVRVGDFDCAASEKRCENEELGRKGDSKCD